MGVLATDQRTSGVEIAFAWIFTLLTLGYLLPWAIAATRGKSNSVAIGVLNLLLGWTVIGWVIALVMACTAHRQRLVVRG
jgi:ABC-type transport system involved in cytochrome c biogenesis permease component